MRTREHFHFKVGVFLNLGLILFVVAILALGSTKKLLSRHHDYYVVCPNAKGLLRGASVMLAGVAVGTVKTFELRPGPSAVRITLSIGSQYAPLIREDTKAQISSEGIVGERIVSLSPGSEGKRVLDPKSEIPFKEGMQIEEALGKAENFLDNVTRLTGKLDRVVMKIDRGSGSLSGLLNDPGLYDNAKALVGEANENRILRNLVRKTIEKAQKHRAPAAEKQQKDSK